MLVKLFSWEDFAFSRVAKVREEEVGHLKKFAYLLALLMFLVLSISSFVSVGTFSIYVLLGNALTPETVFPSLVSNDVVPKSRLILRTYFRCSLTAWYGRFNKCLASSASSRKLEHP